MIGRLVRTLRWPFLLFLFATIVWISWYAYAKGFGRRWRGLLEKEFDRYGLTIDVSKLTLDPFHGLIARDLAIFDSKSGDTLLAQINHIALDINYANLFQHEPALNAVDLRGARIVIPIDPRKPAGERIRLTDFNARIYFLAGRIEVRQASGKLYGIHFDASGTILHPQSLPAVILAEEHDPDPSEVRLGFITALFHELKSMRYPAAVPEMKFSFQVDMADPAAWRLDAGHVVASRLIHGEDELRHLTADFIYQNHCLHIQQCHVRDEQGELVAVADWDFGSGKKQFQARSTLDVGRLLKHEPRVGWLRDWTFEAPPQIDVTGVLERDGSLQFIGKVNFERFAVRGIPFQSMKASFSHKGNDWMVSNAEVTHRSGTLTGEFLYTAQKFRLRLQSALNPTAVSPLLPEELRSMCAPWEFVAPPVIQVSVSGKSANPADISGQGQAWLGRTRFRGVFANSASVSFRIGDGKVVADNVQVTRDEGSGFGRLTYDFIRHEISAIDVQARIYPTALANWLDPRLAGLVDVFRFNVAPTATMVLGSGETSGRVLTLKIHTNDPFSFRWGGLELPFDAGDSEFHLDSREVRLTRFEGKHGAGVCAADAVATLNGDAPVIEANLRLSRLDLTALELPGRWLKPYSGRINGTLGWRQANRTGAPALMTGSIQVDQARFEEGGLFQPVVNRLRAAGLEEPALLALDFAATGPDVTIDSFRILAGNHSLQLKGSIGLVGGFVDLSGAVDEEALQARVTGTLESPEWELTGPRR
jgi:hypothetical protein